MKLAWLVFLLLSMLGCACHKPAQSVTVTGPKYTSHQSTAMQTLHVPVWFDPGTSTRTRMEVAEALRQWNIALNGHMSYFVAGETTSDAGLYLAMGGLGMEIVPEHVLEHPEGELGWVDALGDPIVHIVTDSLVVPDVTVVILHEMGHSLGLDHTPKQGDLMNPYFINQIGCVDEDTARAVAYRFGWEATSMNWCTP